MARQFNTIANHRTQSQLSLDGLLNTIPSGVIFNAVANFSKAVAIVWAPVGLGKRVKPSVRCTCYEFHKGTTKTGFVNKNGQVVVRAKGRPGTDHLQQTY